MTIKRVLAAPGRLARERKPVKITGLLIAFVAIAVLAMPAMTRVSAQEAHQLEALFGSVVQTTAPDRLTVATDAGVETLIVPGEEVFTGNITNFESIAEGYRVVASAYLNQDGDYVADSVLVKDGNEAASSTKHILGVIIESGDGEVSIQDNDGNTLSLMAPEGVAVPIAGTVVTAVVQVDGSTGNLTARAFDLVEDAVQRLRVAADAATDPDVKADLETRLENARDEHLTALERARVALQRAKNAIQGVGTPEAEQAQIRLNEVQATFNNLKARYQQDAADRDERQPELHISGSIRYGETAWQQHTGVFNLAIELGDSVDNSSVRAFTWDESTMAIIPIEVLPDDSDTVTPLETAGVAPSQQVPLNSVKGLIPNGSRITVQYDPNPEIPAAKVITVLPPQLPDVIEDALAQQQLRNFAGFVTVVEETPDLDTVLGVVVVSSGDADRKVAAKIVESTVIEIDGKTSSMSDLAAGMAVEVEFATNSDGSDGRLDAKKIRARTAIDENEAHISGIISGINPEERSATVKPVSGASVTVSVPADASIVKDSQPSRFGDLRAGDLVLNATRFNRDTFTVSRFVAQSPRSLIFSGSITGVDRNPDRISVTTANGEVAVVFITETTSIHSESGDPLGFDALSIGARVLKGAAQAVEQGGRTVNVASDLLIGPPPVITARGVVRASDPDTGELVIVTTPSGRELASTEITLQVSDERRPVMYKNGEQIRALALIAAGDIVESVSYDAETLVIQKLSVVSPNIQRVRGTVVSARGETLVMSSVNGREISLSIVDETQITVNGRTVDSLSRVAAGANIAQGVYIALTEDLTRGVAVQLVVSSGSTGSEESGTPNASVGQAVIETTVSGVLTDVDGGIWAIGARRFRVTSDTQFFGATPAIGLVAKATLKTNDGNELVAVAISVAGRPDTNPSSQPAEIRPAEPSDTPDDGSVTGLVRISGNVQKLAEQGDGALTLVIDAVEISADGSTRISGEPQVGARAIAVVRRSAGGTIVAVSIIFAASPENEEEPDDPVDPTRTPEPSTTPQPSTTPEPSNTPEATTTPEASQTPGATATATPGDAEEDGDNAGELTEVTIVVEEIDGRLVLAEGRLYLLTAEQSLTARDGDTLTLNVRLTAYVDLSVTQLATVADNPLYLAMATSNSSPIYVAE